MSDRYSLVYRGAKGFGMVMGRVHEGLGTEQNRRDTTIFEL
jgi:hypothetical protein